MMRTQVGQKLLTWECCPFALHFPLKGVLALPAISSLPSPSEDCLQGHTGSLNCENIECRRRGMAWKNRGTEARAGSGGGELLRKSESVTQGVEG